MKIEIELDEETERNLRKEARAQNAPIDLFAAAIIAFHFHLPSRSARGSFGIPKNWKISSSVGILPLTIDLTVSGITSFPTYFASSIQCCACVHSAREIGWSK